jgi:hypothetical protein
MENASRAFLDAVRKSMRQIRTVIGATTIDPKLLTAAERASSMRAICAARRPMWPSWLCRRAAHRSSRSCVRLALAGSWYGGRYAENAMMSSGPARAHSISTCHGWTISGRLAVEMELSSGVA